MRYYCQRTKDLPITTLLLNQMKKGDKFMIIDGDGSPLSMYPEGAEVSHEFIDKMYKNLKYPFGHGYVYAYILFMMYNDWIKKKMPN
jgi:hypothetical protein